MSTDPLAGSWRVTCERLRLNLTVGTIRIAVLNEIRKSPPYVDFHWLQNIVRLWMAFENNLGESMKSK